jgi:HK97 family phage major capsid protein
MKPPQDERFNVAVLQGLSSAVGFEMVLRETQVQTRHAALQADVDAAYADLTARRITQKQFDEVMDRAERELKKLNALAHVGSSSPGDYQAVRAAGGSHFKSVRQKNLSPLDIPQSELENMYEAARCKRPYRATITHKTLEAGAPNIGLKTPGSPIAEGAQWPTGLFPPDLRLELTQELRYEPDRIADHIPTITIEAPSIEYLIHTGNTNPAAVVAELGTKPDIGIQLSTATAVPIKLAALASCSLEALQDFSYFASWVPRELQRALINAETDQLVMGTGASGALPGMTGFVATSGVLTRAYSSTPDDNRVDTLLKSFADLRIGSAFAVADLVAMHPSTWRWIRQTKTTTGAYVLGMMDPNEIGQLDNLWGVRVITNTFVPIGTAVVLDTNLAAKYFVRQALTMDTNIWGDTEWTTNSISFRCEMRSTLAVLRPAAVCIVTNLGPTGGS